MRAFLSLVPCVALACSLSVEGTDMGESTGSVLSDGDSSGTGGSVACGEIHAVGECLAVGCVPLEVLPVVYGSAVNDPDDACAFGEPVVVCSPPEQTQECADARICADDRQAWVMPMPDGAALVALVDVSCGVPDGFLPCPETPDGDELSGGNAATESGTDGASDSTSESDGDPLVVACACACD